MTTTNIYVNGFGNIKEEKHYSFIMLCLVDFGLTDYRIVTTYRSGAIQIAFLPEGDESIVFESLDDTLEHVKERYGVDILKVLAHKPDIFHVQHWIKDDFLNDDISDDDISDDELIDWKGRPVVICGDRRTWDDEASVGKRKRSEESHTCKPVRIRSRPVDRV